MPDLDGLGPVVARLVRAVLSAGGAADGRFSGGLWLGRVDQPHAAGSLYMEGSIRRSTALGCKAILAAGGQSIAPLTAAALAFDTEIADTDGCFTPTDTKLYARREGYYLAGGGWAFNSGVSPAASRMQVLLRLNGSSVYVGANQTWTTTAASRVNSVAAAAGMIAMGPGDYIEICAFHDQAAAVSTIAASGNHSNAFGWLVRTA
jgi:hypothetical protein